MLNIFHVLIACLFILFAEVFIQHFCPRFNQVLFLLLRVEISLCILDTSRFAEYAICKYFFQSVTCPLFFLTMPFTKQTSLILVKCNLSIKIFFLLKTVFSQSSFRLMAKLRGGYRDFPYSTCPHLCTASPIIDISHQSGTFITTDESTLAHHYHLKSIVYIRVYP